jgi:hypothetical protein
MQAALQLIGLAVLLAAIAPVAMAGGQMIAAFMLGRHILPWVGITLLTMVLLVAGGVLALQVVTPMRSGQLSQGFAPLVSAVVLVVPPWFAWIAGKRWIEKKVTA